VRRFLSSAVQEVPFFCVARLRHASIRGRLDSMLEVGLAIDVLTIKDIVYEVHDEID